MQTFLPYSDFAVSAKCLDKKRLNKQIVEVAQILKAINNPLYGWQNHPAVNMWRGYQCALAKYGLACYEEWRARHTSLTAKHKSGEQIKEFISETNSEMPPWLNGKIHETHRSKLLFKAPEHYNQFGWTEPNNLDYYWPV